MGGSFFAPKVRQDGISLQFFWKKPLTGGDKCGIVGITCEWVLSFCALFRFRRAGRDRPAGRQKVFPDRGEPI